MALSVKTRTPASPKGMSRVYFACHPDDFEKYFENICDDIFSTQAPAIYYEEDYSATVDESELTQSLLDMRLLVVPVTSTFLYNASRARDFECKLAFESHIPILPILVERDAAAGWTSIMNRISAGLGDVQFLDKSLEDASAISYDEKLSKMLSTTLFGNELIDRIRASFDGYIFFSYRKKDRAKAREVMQLIHDIPFCRDMAIWYDEYLVPGEAWNTEITMAMEKSRFMILLVTPSILEPGNFVMVEEYPGALKNKLTIVPLEAEFTDRILLKACFEGIDAPCNVYDENLLAETLAPFAAKEMDNTPEHLYLIGMAYLYGIDTERDTQKGVSLIREAAEKGSVEALKKLSDMYNRGDGVPRDYFESARWQEAHADSLGKENPGSNEHLLQLCLCGAYWKSLGQYDKAKDIFNKTIEVADNDDKQCLTIHQKSIIAICFGKLGDICMEEGDTETAIEYNDISIETMRELMEEDPSEERQTNLASVLRVQAVNYMNIGSFHESLALLKESIELSKAAVATTHSVDARERLAASYGSMGDLCIKINQLENAEIYINYCVDIRDEIAAETQKPFEINRLAKGYYKLGKICRLLEKYDEALEHYNTATEMFSFLVETVASVDALNSLALGEKIIAGIHEERENYEEALEYYKKAHEHYSRLDSLVDTTESHINYGEACLDLGLCYVNLGEAEAAEELLNECLHILAPIAKNTEIYDAHKFMEIAYSGLIVMREVQGEVEQADKYYEAMLVICLDCFKKSTCRESLLDLINTYLKYATFCYEQGMWDKAHRYVDVGIQSVELMPDLIPEDIKEALYSLKDSLN